MTTDVEGAGRTRKRARKAGRKPHNAKPGPAYLTTGELLEAVATEERPVEFRGQQVLMSRRERSLRIMIGRALEGNVRDLNELLRLMMKYPETAATARDVIVLRGALCNV